MKYFCLRILEKSVVNTFIVLENRNVLVFASKNIGNYIILWHLILKEGTKENLSSVIPVVFYISNSVKMGENWIWFILSTLHNVAVYMLSIAKKVIFFLIECEYSKLMYLLRFSCFVSC